VITTNPISDYDTPKDLLVTVMITVRWYNGKTNDLDSSF